MDPQPKQTPAEFLGEANADTRKVAIYALVMMFREGYSQREVLDHIEDGKIDPPGFLKALRTLEKSGDLDHAMTLVWSRFFERNS